MLAITPNRANEIQRASRALLVFFIFMAVITLWGTLATVVHPFPPGTRTLAGIEFQIATITSKIEILWYVQLVLGTVLESQDSLSLHQTADVVLQRPAVHRSERRAHPPGRPDFLLCDSALAHRADLRRAGDCSRAGSMDEDHVFLPGGSLMGGIFFLFATRLMSEARELRDEQDLVV